MGITLTRIPAAILLEKKAMEPQKTTPEKAEWIKATLHGETPLFTDMYQLTMAQLYFRMGLHRVKAQFDHFFRKCPNYDSHQAGFCINAGLEWLLDWMEEARFRPVHGILRRTGGVVPHKVGPMG